MPLADGGVIAASLGFSELDDQSAELEIRRYSAYGELLWMHSRTVFIRYGLQQAGHPGSIRIDIDANSQGDVFLVEPSISLGDYLVRLSPNGDVLFDVPIAYAHEGAVRVAVTESGTPIVATGLPTTSGLPPYALLTSMHDPWGNAGSLRNQGFYGQIGGLVAGSTGAVLAYGHLDSSIGGSIRVFDEASMNPLWEGKLRPHPANSEIVIDAGFTPDGGVVAVAPHLPQIVPNPHGFTWGRFDASGSRIAGQEFPTTEESFAFRVAGDAAGATYLAGWQQDPGAQPGDPGRFSVWKFDASGTLEWQLRDTVGPPGRSWASALAVTPSGNLFVTGRYDDAQAGVDLLVDPSGSVLWRQQRSGETAHFGPYPTGRDDVCIDEHGHVWRSRQTPTRTNLASLVLGTEIGVQVCGPAVTNSSGESATITALGSEVADDGNLTLRMEHLPVGGVLVQSFVMVLCSQTQGLVPHLGGGVGTLCLGGAIGRFDQPGEVRPVDPGGSAILRVDASRLPQGAGAVPILAGQTWLFQGWFRDPGGSGFGVSNLTDAVAVSFD